MSLSTYWIEDAFSPLPALPGFDVVIDLDLHDLTGINRISPSEGRTRLDDGHLPYVARMEGQPVSYGWVATRTASIGELDLTFELPPDDRYLWDFATLPDWQGRGFYPRLLQTILERESKNAKRFWIIHAPENLPSGAGMYKAGFEYVGQLSFTTDGNVGLAPFPDFDRTHPQRRKPVEGSADRCGACPLLALRRDGSETTRPGRYRFVLAAKENE